MIFQELLEYCKAKSLESVFLPSEESIWRSISRTYSKKFNTPLHLVEKLNMEHVILNVLEDQLNDVDPLEKVEDLLDQIYTLSDPEYKRQKDEDMDAFIHIAEAAEAKRREGMQPKKSLSEKEKQEQENRPTGGSVDFSGLKNES